MSLKELDFSKCRYNPAGKTFVKDISHDIPIFEQYEHEKKREVFRYVVSMYDKNSPLWYKEPEYFQRKILAVNLCELSKETNGGSFSGFSREVMEGRNKEVNQLVVAYLANLGDIEYTMLINELTMYYGYTLKMMSADLLDKAEYTVLKELSKNISLGTNKIFGSGQDEELTRVKTLLYEKAEQDRQRMNPEAVVKMLETDGDFPVDWGRYGKYIPEDLKFMADDQEG